jgi:tetratricopeptide (TPR) repeat protein
VEARPGCQTVRAGAKTEPNHAEKAAFRAGLALALAGQGKIDEATKQARQALDANPNSLAAHYVLACGLWVHGQAKEAEEEFRKTLDSAQPSEAPESDNDRAFIMATCPIQSLRNAAEAVKLAERANKKTGENHLDILDTLAAAYANAGRYDEAVAMARKTIDLAAAQDSPEMVRLMQTRLALYEAHQPLREPAGR